ncbi:MAG: acetyl-CoA carboxylase biotin carboxyl carrier protein subunit [Pyrinomonadaceae bacterium]|nr:acetyl-CoA carboxylase biotin carboxyl carrier protein subunit [Sphingobacteriaceae bacterium]
MYTLKVNQKHIFKISEDGSNLMQDGVKIAFDLQRTAESGFNILYHNKSYNVEVIGFNKTEKTFLLKVNNKPYTVQAADRYDDLLKKMGLEGSASTTIKDIKAPMPGLVIQILVKEGQQILKGDNLIILEAMKMENSIKSPFDAVVKLLKVKVGDKLEKNQIMIVF